MQNARWFMSITRKDKDGCTFLKIEGAMSIYDAASIHKEFMEAFAACDTLTLDLHGVQDCDAAGIQVISAAGKTAEEEGKGFSISGVATAILDTINSAGLSPDEILGSKVVKKSSRHVPFLGKARLNENKTKIAGSV